MNIEQTTLKRPFEKPLLSETGDKRPKTALIQDVSRCISVMEVSDLMLDPARVNPGGFISSQYDFIRAHIGPHLDENDLMTLRCATTHWKNHAERILIEGLNNKTLLLKDLNFVTVDQVSAFFDKNCKLITVLNLTGFERVASSDVENILNLYPNVQDLTLNCSHKISSPSIILLSKMKNLRKLEFKNCCEK